MAILFSILISTFLISLIAFLGALILFLKEELLDRILLALVAFSAGALIGGAFFHLLPEAIVEVGADEKSLLILFLYLIFGFCSLFFLEQFMKWHHHHAIHPSKIRPFSYLILISDAIHNFIDGLIIAASFMVSFPVGVATALAVALHEIPQEIGDYGILIYGGFEKVKALFLNFLSAITVVLGGIIGFFLAGKIGSTIIFLLPFAAGHFIYIASSDLIPEIRNKDFKKSTINFVVFLSGIALMILVKLFYQ